jgi:hypothetical protein
LDLLVCSEKILLFSYKARVLPKTKTTFEATGTLGERPAVQLSSKGSHLAAHEEFRENHLFKFFGVFQAKRSAVWSTRHDMITPLLCGFIDKLEQLKWELVLPTLGAPEMLASLSCS